MSRKLIFRLAALTLVGFSGIGYLIIENFMNAHLLTLLEGNFSWFSQVCVGCVYGILIAVIGWKIVELPILQPTKTFFVNLITPLRLSLPEIVFISFCAGVGEEILFRGAIQPFLGILLTAVIFVAIHGYLNPSNWRITIYGFFMTFAIVGIGIMTDYFGLLSSVIAHMMIDIILLYKLSFVENLANGQE